MKWVISKYGVSLAHPTIELPNCGQTRGSRRNKSHHSATLDLISQLKQPTISGANRCDVVIANGIIKPLQTLFGHFVNLSHSAFYNGPTSNPVPSPHPSHLVCWATRLRFLDKVDIWFLRQDATQISMKLGDGRCGHISIWSGSDDTVWIGNNAVDCPGWTLGHGRMVSNHHWTANRIAQVIFELCARLTRTVMIPGLLAGYSLDRLKHEILNAIWNSADASLNKYLIYHTTEGKLGISEDRDAGACGRCLDHLKEVRIRRKQSILPRAPTTSKPH